LSFAASGWAKEIVFLFGKEMRKENKSKHEEKLPFLFFFGKYKGKTNKCLEEAAKEERRE
jgi:hypothetical protein